VAAACRRRKRLFSNPELTRIAENYDKTAAQVALHWLIQRGVVGQQVGATTRARTAPGRKTAVENGRRSP
jgi:diketogulonate reductase-like aldo/keto reductase